MIYSPSPLRNLIDLLDLPSTLAPLSASLIHCFRIKISALSFTCLFLPSPIPDCQKFLVCVHSKYDKMLPLLTISTLITRSRECVSPGFL